MVSLTRRRLLLLGLVSPVAMLSQPVTAFARDVESRLAAVRRPAPLGTSATRCAVCGGMGHAMLEVGCPARRDVRR